MEQSRLQLRFGAEKPLVTAGEVWLGDTELTSWTANHEARWVGHRRWVDDEGGEHSEETGVWHLEAVVPVWLAPGGVLVDRCELGGKLAWWAEPAPAYFWHEIMSSWQGAAIGYTFGELSAATGIPEERIAELMRHQSVGIDEAGERLVYWWDVRPLLDRARREGLRFRDPAADGFNGMEATHESEGEGMPEKIGRVFVTGDVHGNIDIRKLGKRSWPEGRELGREDLLVVCGDFGLVWSDPPSANDKYWLRWLNDDCPWTTLFVDGNHENHDMLDAMEVSEWRGGKVHRLSGYSNIIHLMRGQVFDMDQHGRWFTFGGAASHDRAYRTPYKSWWPREMPSEEEMAEGLANLEAVGGEVDYVFTHDCPARYKEAAMFGIVDDPARIKADQLNRYLNEVDDIVDNGRMRKWYCGHYHDDTILRDKRHVLLYRQVVELGGVPEDPPSWWHR